jgi:copper resistance protein B
MRPLLIAILPALWAAPALAQHAGHSSATPAPSPRPQAAPTNAKPNDSGHAGHDMSSMPGMATPKVEGGSAQAKPVPADPHAGHDMSAMPGMSGAKSAPAELEAMGPPPLPDRETAAPAPPVDHLADAVFGAAAMDSARSVLREEHGGARVSQVMANLLERQVRSGRDGYRWDGQAWFGGDLNRFVLKTEGEGDRHGVESGEVQALYSRAVGLYTDFQLGVRQDLEPKSRTYATAGFQTLLPYWIEADGALFLSNKGDLLGRVEGSVDWRLTQRLILQPRAELDFAAQDVPDTATGSGLSEAEFGLRLRYEVRRAFAPYVGVTWAKRFGRTADFARVRGEDISDTSFVIGLRGWF